MNNQHTPPWDLLAEIDFDSWRHEQQWQKRYRQLMQWGQHLSSKPWLREEQYRVRGCESPAWLSHCRQEEQNFFAIEAEGRLISGLAVILLKLIDGLTSRELEDTDWAARFAELGLEQHLSPSRSNGFKALLDRALELAADGQSQ